MNNFELSDSDLMNEVSKFRYYQITYLIFSCIWDIRVKTSNYLSSPHGLYMLFVPFLARFTFDWKKLKFTYFWV